jgi:hypothetical protein
MPEGPDVSSGLNVAAVRDFGTALLIGALIGIEREKHRSVDSGAGIGGLRTFILVALLGAIAGWLDGRLNTPWILVAVVLVVTAAALRIRLRRSDAPRIARVDY